MHSSWINAGILRANHCNPKHSVTVKEIAELNKMRMRLGVQHTINHQTCVERSIRTSELILELKKIFENLGIKCHLPPQEIHITQLNLNNWTMPSHSLRQGKSLAVLLAVCVLLSIIQYVEDIQLSDSSSFHLLGCCNTVCSTVTITCTTES